MKRAAAEVNWQENTSGEGNSYQNPLENFLSSK